MGELKSGRAVTLTYQPVHCVARFSDCRHLSARYSHCPGACEYISAYRCTASSCKLTSLSSTGRGTTTIGWAFDSQWPVCRFSRCLNLYNAGMCFPTWPIYQLIHPSSQCNHMDSNHTVYERPRRRRTTTPNSLVGGLQCLICELLLSSLILLV